MNTRYICYAAAACALLCSCKKETKIILETTTVASGEIKETVTATGTLESVTQVDVGTQVTGIIDKLYADYNSVVKKGELIAEIDKTVLQADLDSSDATLESARVQYEYTRTNYNRDKQLYEKKLISEYDYQTSLKDYQVAKQAYDKAQADRVRAAKNLNYAEIYSPIDGIVISRAVEVGQTVVSNMSVANLYTIADLDHMQVVGNVDEADIGQVKVGQHVAFTVDAYPDDEFEGYVTQVRLAATTESNVVTYEVIVSTTNDDHKLIPGLTANLSIYVLEEEGAMTLPMAATKFTPRDYPGVKGLPQPTAASVAAAAKAAQGSSHVYVLRGDSLYFTPVTIGATNGINVGIAAGLKEGDVVATGYSSEAEQKAEQQASGDVNPFAPKRPGGGNRK
ncbi:MAG: efflux RND transporter periplasmic adaptor subunit [Muribaculaceae bacterium]|nr:efflux RND transporter periplasmic adaptor subunit [Muribaculaceae bacterium]